MAPITARARKSLARPQPWDRTKWPSSTPPGWHLSSDGNNWQLPPENWRYNGVYWFLVRDCEAFTIGNCTKGDKCKKFHASPLKPVPTATGDLDNSSTETLIIENVTQLDTKDQSTVKIKSVSRAESTKDESEDNKEAAKAETTPVDVEAEEKEPAGRKAAEAGSQEESAVEELSPQEDLLARLRAVDGFQILADHISQLQSTTSSIEEAEAKVDNKTSNLIIVSRRPFDYAAGIKIYFEWLLEKGLLPKESAFHNFSGQEDCCLYDVQQLIGQEDACHHGLVLITEPSKLCSVGNKALHRLRNTHPGLSVILANQAKSVYEAPQTISTDFPTTLSLITNRKYERLIKIELLLNESLQEKYKSKMRFDDGNDGRLVKRYAQSIHKSCQRNYEEDNVKDKIKESLTETSKRHFDRLLGQTDSDDSNGELFVLGPNDVFPDEEIEDDSKKSSEPEEDAEKSEEEKKEQERKERKEEEAHRKQFQALHDHIDTKIPQLAKLSKHAHGSLLVNWRQLNLRLTDGHSWDYFHGVKPYYQALRAAGFVSNESRYLFTIASDSCGCDESQTEEDEESKSEADDDESDDDADDASQNTEDVSKKSVKRLNCISKVVKDSKDGLLVVDTAEHLCKAGRATLRALQKERPHLFIVLDFRARRASNEVEQFSEELCPYVVDIDEDNAKPKPTTDLEGKVIKAFLESMEKKYEGHMKFEGGGDGSLVQVCVRRIVKKCKTDADEENIEKEVKAYLSCIYNRHLERHMACSEESAADTDFMLLTCADLLGKEPDVTRYETDEWKELNKMVGMESVKVSIQALFDGLLLNYFREIHDQKPLQIGLSKIFLGPAGTGKTTVAKLYGKLLKTFGILSDGDLLVKNASDFIGRYIGYSAHQTKKILEEAKGKVLLIDEAYMLDARRNGSCRPCPFRQEAVDTLVGEVQNKPGDDICIILCGYKKEMEAFIRDANPGFQRRFPLADAFVFDDFTEAQLNAILDLKMETQCLTTTPEGRATAMDVLRLAKQRPNFGNGGEIDNLLSRAMLNFQRRFGSTIAAQDRFEAAKNSVLLPQDFDPNYSRVQNADKNVSADIDMIGMDAQKTVFAQLSTQAKAMKKFGKDPKPYMPFTLVFKGPPGTGKTSFARHIGRIYYEMGILASADVVEASTTDMIAGYVGQTAGKTRKLLESGLGKVLLIDEAYRLGGAEEGRSDFSREARDELVDCLTKPEFARKLVIVLAGYAGETETMLSKNPGLSSRFPMHIDFEPLPSSLCAGLLKKRIEEADLVADFDDHDQEVLGCLDKLRQGKQWSNGRDVETMAAEMVRKSFEASAMVIDVENEEEPPMPKVTKELALEVMNKRLPRIPGIKKNPSFDIRSFQVLPKSKPIP